MTTEQFARIDALKARAKRALENKRDAQTLRSEPVSDLENLRIYINEIAKVRERTSRNWIEKRDLFSELFLKHLVALRLNFRRALRKNDYGGIERDDRSIEVRKLLESETKQSKYYDDNIVIEMVNHIQQMIDKLMSSEKTKGFDPLSFPNNGLDFEFWVANSLQMFGWQTQVTTATGDQGIDILGKYESMTAGFQCKLYTGKVGNSAVQEVLAGLTHYGLNKGAVVTISGYTRSAHVLAKSTGIILAKVSDIPFLHSILNSCKA